MEMKIDGKICGMSFLSSHVHARQQTPNLFQPGFIFNNFVDEMFVDVLQAACEQLETSFYQMRCLFQTTFAWPIFCIVFTG